MDLAHVTPTERAVQIWHTVTGVRNQDAVTNAAGRHSRSTARHEFYDTPLLRHNDKTSQLSETRRHSLGAHPVANTADVRSPSDCQVRAALHLSGITAARKRNSHRLVLPASVVVGL
jgi:hypothetical protein